MEVTDILYNVSMETLLAISSDLSSSMSPDVTDSSEERSNIARCLKKVDDVIDSWKAAQDMMNKDDFYHGS